MGPTVVYAYMQAIGNDKSHLVEAATVIEKYCKGLVKVRESRRRATGETAEAKTESPWSIAYVSSSVPSTEGH